MPKFDPRQFSAPRPGHYWSYEVLRQKVLDLNAAWKSVGLPGDPIWEFSIDRGFRDEGGGSEVQVLTDKEFFGDDAKDPIPGKYSAETTAEGQRIVLEGIHYDVSARAERNSRGESEGESLRRAISEQFTRYEHEVARLRRQIDQREDSETKQRREIESYIKALRDKDTEILTTVREKDAALNERDEAILRMEVAVEEKRQLVEDNEQFKEPLRILGGAIVANALEYFGVMAPEGEGGEPPEPAAVRAAGNIIVMAVLSSPEAQEVLRLEVNEEGEPLIPIVQEPDIDAIDFVIAYLQEVARAGTGAGEQSFQNGAAPHEADAEDSEAEAQGTSP